MAQENISVRKSSQKNALDAGMLIILNQLHQKQAFAVVTAFAVAGRNIQDMAYPQNEEEASAILDKFAPAIEEYRKITPPVSMSNMYAEPVGFLIAHMVFNAQGQEFYFQDLVTQFPIGGKKTLLLKDFILSSERKVQADSNKLALAQSVMDLFQNDPFVKKYHLTLQLD